MRSRAGKGDRCAKGAVGAPFRYRGRGCMGCFGVHWIAGSQAVGCWQWRQLSWSRGVGCDERL